MEGSALGQEDDGVCVGGVGVGADGPGLGDLEVERVNVAGLEVAVLDLEMAAKKVVAAARLGHKGYVCVTGGHGIVESERDDSLRVLFNRAFLVVPDGMPLVWMGRYRYGKKQMGRVYGPDLMLEVMRLTEGSEIRHFFYGGKEGRAEELREAMLRRFPGANIVGVGTPPFRALEEGEIEELSKDIERCRPHLMWVGISTPKQDRFMAEVGPRLAVPISLGVGAAFDFHTGHVAQAPGWMQRGGLEWLYRLTREPARLWPRYSRVVPRLLYLFFLQVSGLRQFPVVK
jgi:N-acetylglucosaminyldiphosphoundecaprenol N-acetyl-beta-D-mannosaminyltransferase